MATRTSYLNLIKPNYSDAADIADINANMDTLDTTIQGLDETGSKSLTAHNNATDAHSAMQATVDDTLAPTADLNTIRNLLSNLGNRIKAATGASGWKADPSTTLASLATLASNMASGSDVTWSGKTFTNTKLGITGLMDTNGYISFGPNFGGLIIQWVTVSGSTISGDGYATASLPVTYSTAQFGCWMCTLDAFSSTSIYGCTKNGLNAIKYAYRRDNAAVSYSAMILSVGA